MTGGYRKDSQVFRVNTYDPIGSALKETVGIEPDHALYLLLYDAAATARRHRLPINIDTLAFTIARTPTLKERWATHEHSEDTLTQRIGEAVKECTTPRLAGQEAT